MKIWEGKISLPTYLFDEEDPYPDLFVKTRRYALAYPYPLLNNLTKNREVREYRLVYLENEYLRVSVCPDLGGHLYSAHDKINGREVFYLNRVVKPRPLGVRGAWSPMGIEFNFPYAHSPMTLSAVHYALRENPDGSATIVISDIDRISRMRWSIDITLHPERNFVEARPTFHNRTSVPNYYYYWANAAIPVSDGTRYVYPIHRTRPHGVAGKADPWPVQGGVDRSWHRNIRGTFGLFAHDCREDFFGAYDVEKDWGVAHVANYRELPGKKLFDWGMLRSGLKWASEFSEHDGPYAELQDGLFENQGTYEIFEPHDTIHVSEVWVPVHKLGAPFSRANDEAAVALEVRETSGAAPKAHVGANVTRRQPGARIVLTCRGRELLNETRDLAPEAPFAKDVELPRDAKETDLELSVVSGSGDVLLSHRPGPWGREKGRSAWLDAKTHPDETSEDNGDDIMNGNGANTRADKLFVRGAFLEKNRLLFKARSLYEKALKVDPTFAPARMRLGILCVRSGEYAIAADHLTRALTRNPELVHARYHLGLAYAGMGEETAAKDEFWGALKVLPDENACRMQLGLIATRERNLREAADFFGEVSQASPHDTQAAGMLSAALRRLGRPADALARIEPALFRFPSDFLLCSELHRVKVDLKRDAEAAEALATFDRVMDRGVDAYIELATDYQNAGLFEEAADVIRRAIDATTKDGYVYPLLCYHAGFCIEKLGRADDAKPWYRKGGQMKPDHCFPSRTEDLAVVRRALEVNPDDARARYYLGNLLYAKDRRAEGVAAWRRAARATRDSHVLCRNLAIAAWERDDPAEAERWLRKAIRLEPYSERLRLELDHVMSELHKDKQRLAMLEAAFEHSPESDGIREHYAMILIDHGNPERALEIISGHKFSSRHGVFTLTRLHINANVSIGERHFARGDYETAYRCFDAARQTPVTLGEDETITRFFGKPHYLAGLCMMKMGRRREAKTCWRECVGENHHMLPELFYYDFLSYKGLGRAAKAKERLKRLGEVVARMERSQHAHGGYVHYLRSLWLRGRGRTAEADKQLKLAHRHGWRDSKANNFAHMWGFA